MSSHQQTAVSTVAVLPPLQVKSFDMAYPVESASLCAGSKRFAAGGGDMWAHLYSFEDGQELQCNKGGHDCHSCNVCMLAHFLVYLQSLMPAGRLPVFCDLP